MNRRKFLTLSGGALALSSKTLLAKHAGVSVEPLNLESDLALLAGRYTPVENFYVRNHHETPQYPMAPLLRVEGEVAKPVRLTPADLTHLRRLQLGGVLECAGNPVSSHALVSNGIWEGWSLWEVLELAHPSRAAPFLHLFGGDGYARSVLIDRARDGAMLVANLGGRPLQPNHGAPWRAFFPGWYGMDSVKWLDRIVVSPAPLATDENEYLEMRPATPVGIARRPLPRIQVKSVITSPVDRSVVHRGAVEIRGLAWSGTGSISKIELATDGGTNWHDVGFPPGSRYEWVLWRASVELTQPGTAELTCRATDTQGLTQPALRDVERLDGYAQNRYHRVQVLVV